VKRKALLWASLLAVLLVGGVAAWLVLKRNPAPPAPIHAEELPPELPPGAEVSLEGTVQAPHIVLVGSPVSGTVEAVDAAPGTEVFEGQLLARIRNTSVEAERDIAFEDLDRARQRLSNLESALIATRLEASRAEAEATRARAEFDRKRQTASRQQLLYAEGATPRLVHEKAQKEFETAKMDDEAASELARQARERVAAALRDIDNARKQVEEREAEFEHAREEFDAGEIHSPVDGMVVATRAVAGAEVTPEMADLFQIGVDLSVLQVTVEPEPPVLERLQPGLPVLVNFLEWSPEPVEGEIESIQDGKVRVRFPRPDPAIRPGTNATVRLKLL
jgi:multidrug resistance efflux pump